MLDAIKAKLAALITSREQAIIQVHLHDGAIHTLTELIAEAEAQIATGDSQAQDEVVEP